MSVFPQQVIENGSFIESPFHPGLPKQRINLTAEDQARAVSMIEKRPSPERIARGIECAVPRIPQSKREISFEMRSELNPPPLVAKGKQLHRRLWIARSPYQLSGKVGAIVETHVAHHPKTEARLLEWIQVGNRSARCPSARDPHRTTAVLHDGASIRTTMRHCLEEQGNSGAIDRRAFEAQLHRYTRHVARLSPDRPRRELQTYRNKGEFWSPIPRSTCRFF